MKQAASLGHRRCRCCCPASTSRPAPDDFYPIEREQLVRFNGKTWELFGKVYGR